MILAIKNHRKPANSKRANRAIQVAVPRGALNRLPKQTSRFIDIIIEEAHREVTVKDESGPIKLPMIKAAMRSLAINAARGNIRAQKLLMEILAMAEKTKKAEKDQTLNDAVDYVNTVKKNDC